jgi:hypothetical protein
MLDDVDYNTDTPEQVSDLVNDLGNALLENAKVFFGETNRKSKQNTCMNSKP